MLFTKEDMLSGDSAPLRITMSHASRERATVFISSPYLKPLFIISMIFDLQAFSASSREATLYFVGFA